MFTLSACQQGLLEGRPQGTETTCFGSDCTSHSIQWGPFRTHSKDFYTQHNERGSGYFQNDDKRHPATSSFQSICFDPTQTDPEECQNVQDPHFRYDYGDKTPVVIQNFRLQLNIEKKLVFKGGWVKTARIDLDESTNQARYTEIDVLKYPRVVLDNAGNIDMDLTDDGFCKLSQTHAIVPVPNSLSHTPGPNYQVGFDSLFSREEVLSGLYFNTQSSLNVIDQSNNERNYFDSYLTGGSVSIAGLQTITHSFGTSFNFIYSLLNNSSFLFGFIPDDNLRDLGNQTLSRYKYPNNDFHKTNYLDSTENLWYSFTFGRDFYNPRTQKMEVKSDSYWKERVIIGACLNGFKVYDWDNFSGSETHPLFLRSRFKTHQVFSNNSR